MKIMNTDFDSLLAFTVNLSSFSVTYPSYYYVYFPQSEFIIDIPFNTVKFCIRKFAHKSMKTKENLIFNLAQQKLSVASLNYFR